MDIIHKVIIVILLIISFSIGAFSAANAQTLLPPGGNQSVPQSTIDQAEQQKQGIYSIMARPSAGIAGGQIQEAWNKSEQSQGAHRYEHCGDCVYKVRTRQFMVTSLVLPTGSQITNVDLGDTGGFQVKVITKNILAVRPRNFGIDTNLNVYTKSGEVFVFYIRSESHNSSFVPDLLIKIDPAFVDEIEVAAFPTTETGQSKIISSDGNNPATDARPAAGVRPTDEVSETVLNDLAEFPFEHRDQKNNDFLETIEFNPARLHGFKEYTLWGDDELKPEIVFRDDHFTYLQFGDKWDSIELPVAYVVIDGIDELVNTRVQGRTYIIENTAELISLKSGTKFMCLRYSGETT